MRISRDRHGRVSLGPFEYFVQLLIILSLISFALETLPSQTPGYYTTLYAIEYATLFVFVVEYGIRLVLARPPQRYAFSFFGVVDLMAILPLLLAPGLDLRSVRAFRLLRLFRIFKLARCSEAMARFHRAARLIREELILFGVVASIVVYLAAVGIYYCEHEAQPEKFQSVFDALWWAVGTLTTVGYGDVYPVTLGGRIFTSIVLIVGLGIVAVPTGMFAAALAKARALED